MKKDFEIGDFVLARIKGSDDAVREFYGTVRKQEDAEGMVTVVLFSGGVFVLHKSKLSKKRWMEIK